MSLMSGRRSRTRAKEKKLQAQRKAAEDAQEPKRKKGKKDDAERD
jgi:hypothetical protein